MEHIVQFSGGKDSTAMLLMMLEKGMQVDEIIFCDTGKEFPQMYDHIDKVESYIKLNYGLTITKLHPEKSFDYWFSEHVKTRGKNKGKKGYGWANSNVRWCTKFLKSIPTEIYLKRRTYKSYIGIAADEPDRHERKDDNVVHPLFDWGITEKQALEYCYSKGFDWGGLYDDYTRVSCWCCPLQTLNHFRVLYKKHPNLWKALEEMDEQNTNYNKFNHDYTVKDLKIRFQFEEERLKEGLSITNRDFHRKLKERLM